ncbi:MAG: hypothetical protein ABIR96_13350 [Bdellovibrionota bacterium]
MFPLRPTNGVSRFPWATLVIVLAFVVAEIVVRASSGTRLDVLLSLLKAPADFSYIRLQDWAALALSMLVFGNLFALWITSLYVWSFVPALIERSSIAWSVIASVAVTVGSFSLYRLYHGPHAVAPLLLAQVWVSALLGLAMRHEIWETVSTFVFGLKIFKIFEVPSYVLLFFWFFYIMVGNLFLDAPLSDAPTPYLLPLTAFILAFVVESLRVFKPTFRKVASP